MLWFLFLVEGTNLPNRRTENEIRTNQFSTQQRTHKCSAPRQLRGIACWYAVRQRRLRAHRPAVHGQLFVQRWAHRPVKTKVLRYELTDNGKTSYREKDRLGLAGNKQVQGDLCYGQQALDKIVNSQGPTAAGDSKEVTVFYTYRIENLAEWAKSPAFREFFPELFRPLTGPERHR